MSLATCCLRLFAALVCSLLLIVGLVLLIPFPLAFYPAIIRQSLFLQQDESGQFPTTTFYWANPPAITHYDFHLFNVTNADDVLFNGAKVIVKDRGPYSWIEKDKKDPVDFSADGDTVRYEVHKTWRYDQKSSCPQCSYDDEFYLPNLSLMTTSRLLNEYENITHAQRFAADISLLMLGMYPFRKVRMADVLFVGYTDPLIDVLNSNLTNWLQQHVTHGPLLGFPTPNITWLGYFPRYNHTTDEDYVADTGKSNSDGIGKILQWANSSTLKWWGDDYANNVSGSVDGVYNGAFLDKKKPMRLFQSFLCRHFEMEYDSETSVEGIGAYQYRFSADNLNPYVGNNYGYVFDNRENATYFDDWPCPANASKWHIIADCSQIDCRKVDNFCSPCCNRTDAYAFPPGFVQQQCFPGRNRNLSFTALLSLPHFYGAPSFVQNSVEGLSPNEELHNMGEFQIQPTVGSTLKARFRTQFNIPVYKTKKLTSLNNARSSVVPCFWLLIRVQLQDYAYDFIRFPTTTLPKIALGLGIGFVVLSALLLALFIFCSCRRRFGFGGGRKSDEGAYAVRQSQYSKTDAF